MERARGLPASQRECRKKDWRTGRKERGANGGVVIIEVRA